MANINQAFQWAVNTCNASNVGYSQTYRNEQTVDGITYYDCSSFIWYALKAGGFDVEGAYNSALWTYEGNAVTTGYMPEWLTALGFKQISVTGEWKAGDIGLNSGHTEMVYSGGSAKGVCMGAHTANATLENQVSIGSSGGNASYESTSDRWESLWRYGDGATGEPTLEWIYYDTDEAGKMSTADQENNVLIIWSVLTVNYGWTREAVAGALGSMQIESYFNPAQWELGHKTDTVDGYGYGYGYGLIQWTRPSSSYPNPYLNYCYENNIDRLDGTEQLKCLNTEITTSNLWGWIATTDYPESFDEYKNSTASPVYLASVWFHNLERPPASDTTETTRQEWANYWYEWLEGKTPVVPNGSGDSGTTTRKGLSKLLLYSIALDLF